MATTDSNGLVLLEATDSLVPLQTTINGVTSSISTALNNSVRTFKAASDSARNTLATKRTPSATNPLVVWRTDKKWWDINDGSGWKSIHPDTNKIVVNGVAYQRSGTLNVGTISSWIPIGTGLYYFMANTATLGAPPTGYRYSFLSPAGDGNGGMWVFRTSKTLSSSPEVYVVTSINASKTGVVIPWMLAKI